MPVPGTIESQPMVIQLDMTSSLKNGLYLDGRSLYSGNFQKRGGLCGMLVCLTKERGEYGFNMIERITRRVEL